MARDQNLMPILLGGAAVYAAYRYGLSSGTRHLDSPKVMPSRRELQLREALPNYGYYGTDFLDTLRGYFPGAAAATPAAAAAIPTGASGASSLAPAAMQDAGTTRMVELSDGAGTFRVYSDGAIEVLSGYANAGRVFKPGDATYDQLVKNLSAVGNNANEIAAMVGLPKYQAAMASPVVATPSGAAATAADVVEGNVVVPFYQHPWFMPAAVVGGAAVLGLAILVVPWDKVFSGSAKS